MGNSANGPGVEAGEIVQYESRPLARGICTCVGIPRNKMTTNPPPSATRSPALSKRQIAFAALRHRDYRRYFFVIMLSQMGDNIEHVISYWLLFQKFHSPALGGFAVISHWTPASIFCGLFWRACRPSRLPPGTSGGPTDARRRLSSLGHSFSYRYDSSVARLRSADHPWHGRSSGWTRKPTHHSRHRWA